MHPPPPPARTDFTLIIECTPESSGCNSVYSVVEPNKLLTLHTDAKFNQKLLLEREGNYEKF
jgi:hypothetical protein